MTTLFAARGTISSAVALTLEEAGMPYDLRVINNAAGEQRTAKYLAINPKGRVPALRTDRGVLSEAGAILDYIAAQNPDADLVPNDPFQAAKMREMMYYLASTMHPNHAHGLRQERWTDEVSAYAGMAAKVPETMTASCAYVEDFMVGPFVLGDQMSLADPYLFTVCTWCEGDGVDMSVFPTLTAFRDAFAKRASVKSISEKGLL
ncbi:MAG: glutathione S-transferase family protein [Planktomarina sp.]